MATLGNLTTLYFYLHLPIIHEFWGFIPFRPFELDFLVTGNVAPSKSHPSLEYH